MLDELNNMYALQLDLCPSKDRSGQAATDQHDQTDMLNMVFHGGSDSSRVFDHIHPEHIKLLDATVPALDSPTDLFRQWKEI
jgi:hypothetical protein